MPAWFRKGKKIEGWLAASLGASRVDFAHGRFSAGKPAITVFGSREFGDDKQAAQKLAHELRVDRYGCSALLDPAEYQVLMVEAPNVPREELKGAIRWKIKDMIDYH